jgi:hypothetical protein
MKLEFRGYKIKRGAFKGFYTFAWLPQRHPILRFLLWLVSPITNIFERRRIKKAKQELMRVFAEIQAAQLDSIKKGLELLESLQPYTKKETTYAHKFNQPLRYNHRHIQAPTNRRFETTRNFVHRHNRPMVSRLGYRGRPV